MFVADRDDDEIFCENVVQSVEVRSPEDSELAVGIFSVCTLPADVIPNPPLFDVVANV